MTPDAQARALVEQLFKCQQAERQHPNSRCLSVNEDALVSVVTSAIHAARPTWTDERPTEAGWYWVKSMHRKQPVVRVVEVKRWKAEHRRHGLYIYAARSIERCTKYQWARIEMPEEKP